MKKIITGIAAVLLVFGLSVALADELPTFEVNNNIGYKIYIEHSKSPSEELNVPEVTGSGTGGMAEPMAMTAGTTGRSWDSIYKLPPEIDVLLPGIPPSVKLFEERSDYKLYAGHFNFNLQGKEMGMPEARGSGAGGMAEAMEVTAGTTWRSWDNIYKLPPEIDVLLPGIPPSVNALEER